SPASVSRTAWLVRSSSSTPSSRSSCATDFETACCAMCSRSAARVKLSSCATARNARRWRSSGTTAGGGPTPDRRWGEAHEASTRPSMTARLGLGCMGMSDLYGPADRSESIATIHAALDAGVTLLDTGDFYGMGHNELLIAEALRDRPREDVRISVKFG